MSNAILMDLVNHLCADRKSSWRVDGSGGMSIEMMHSQVVMYISRESNPILTQSVLRKKSSLKRILIRFLFKKDIVGIGCYTVFSSFCPIALFSRSDPIRQAPRALAQTPGVSVEDSNT